MKLNSSKKKVKVEVSTTPLSLLPLKTVKGFFLSFILLSSTIFINSERVNEW
jgi:hypothetical protein